MTRRGKEKKKITSMKNGGKTRGGKFYLIGLAVIFAVLGVYMATKLTESKTIPKFSKEMVVYKSSTCRCCDKWVDHMKENGFNVVAYDVSNVDPYKDKFGVPNDAGSCHTAIVDGYFIEGHVPAQDVRRLLKENPDVAGLAVPEMPVGTPGMEMDNRKDPYNVIAYSKDGSRSIYSSYP